VTVPLSPDTLLARAPAATALTAIGLPTKTSTLAQAAHFRTGPAYVVYNNRCLYKWQDLLDWARSRAKRREPGAPSVIERRLPVHWKTKLSAEKKRATGRLRMRVDAAAEEKPAINLRRQGRGDRRPSSARSLRRTSKSNG
jgi:hypothetical protein